MITLKRRYQINNLILYTKKLEYKIQTKFPFSRKKKIKIKAEIK